MEVDPRQVYNPTKNTKENSRNYYQSHEEFNEDRDILVKAQGKRIRIGKRDTEYMNKTSLLKIGKKHYNEKSNNLSRNELNNIMSNEGLKKVNFTLPFLNEYRKYIVNLIVNIRIAFKFWIRLN